MQQAEPKRLPFWHERQLLADAKRADRRAVVLNRLFRAVHRQIAVNRLCGFAEPGRGGLLEIARKKGEERDTAATMAARKILDSGDGEALVLQLARAEEARHEAVAGLTALIVLHRTETVRHATQVKELLQAKEKAEREMEREKQLRLATQAEVGRLRERLMREAMRMERVMADERRKAERVARVERKVMGRDMRHLEYRVNSGWQEEVGELKNEIKQLRKLTDLMVAGDKKRTRHE
tara:strand:+ start:2542 stop:3252 length:711 start_codon:yes stop_codon:yes gene_type:complete